MPFAGTDKIDPLISPLVQRQAAGGSFTAAPWVVEDAFLDYTGSAHVNLQFSFNGGNGQLESQAGVFPGVQFTDRRPLQYLDPQPPWKNHFWVADVSGDPMDAFFPAKNVQVNINGNLNVGFTRPGLGLTKDGIFRWQGLDNDLGLGGQVIAQADYRIRYIRA